MTDKDLAGTYSRRAKQGSKGKRACRQEAVHKVTVVDCEGQQEAQIALELGLRDFALAALK